VTDWTTLGTAAISAGSAILGAGLGYLTARSQSKVELDRLRYEHEQAHLSHRQAVYHDYLDSVHRFHQDAGGVERFEKVADFQEWAREHEHNLTAVRLFGTQAAADAAVKLSRMIDEAMNATADPDEYSEKYERRLLAAWDECVDAMRPDTAPAEDG
jgi:hypothetical protein